MPSVYGKRKFRFTDILKKKKETHCDETPLMGEQSTLPVILRHLLKLRHGQLDF